MKQSKQLLIQKVFSISLLINQTKDGISKTSFSIANPDTHRVYGQFIRDIWYRAEHKITSNMEFLIVGIKGGFNYNTITS